jgi:predicted regulator of Ras-like GTPase activity (Roadblock/LC7/MglB family)
MGLDQKLRHDRVVFYERDITRFDGELDGFLELSSARAALLIDKDGHLVTRRGHIEDKAIESICALVAGSFAATRELARLMGEEQFTTLYHQGARDSIQISLIANQALLAMVFDDRTSLGLVKYYSVESIKRIEDILVEIQGREGETEALSSDFGSSATAALDRLF